MDRPRTDGSSLSAETIDGLRSNLKGKVVVKGQVPESEYLPLLERWNRMHIKEASIIVLVESEADILTTINFVREHHIDVAISSGRHTYSGPSSGTGLIIDLRNLRKVTVDAEKKIAVAEGGALAGDVERACEKLGLRPVMGAINETGCGGITTGGGIGPLGSQYGLVCDNLLAARVALADGTIAVASETENPDLFWGIRGGGSNFGIVTEFTYKVHESNHNVYFAFYIYAPDKLDSVLKSMNDLHSEYVMKSNGKFGLIGIFGFREGMLLPGFVAFYDGDSDEEVQKWVKPLLDLEPLQVIGGMQPYTVSTDFAQFAAMFPPQFNRLVGTSTQVSWPVADEVLQETVDRFKELVLKDPEHLGVSKMLLDLRDYSKVAAVPLDATAYANRRTGMLIGVDVIWDEPSLDAQLFKETREFMASLREKIKEINAQKGVAEEGTHVAATTLYALITDGKEKLMSVFGPNLPKLRQLKRKYDPDMMWNKWYPIEPAEA
ncbi:hypothetical protein ABW19_dt0203837 [Dactylella cylindrospora]|nr:hypothetical protein ABW19_dt0203837 [Dactylella cylindrospora]